MVSAVLVNPLDVIKVRLLRVEQFERAVGPSLHVSLPDVLTYYVHYARPSPTDASSGGLDGAGEANAELSVDAVSPGSDTLIPFPSCVRLAHALHWKLRCF